MQNGLFLGQLVDITFEDAVKRLKKLNRDTLVYIADVEEHQQLFCERYTELLKESKMLEEKLKELGFFLKNVMFCQKIGRNRRWK